MLSGADLEKILDEGYGDAGFNDVVPDAGERAPSAAKRPSPQVVKGEKPAEKAPAKASKSLPEPHSRPPVLGATPPPPEGADPARYEITMAMDEAAREKGFKSVEEYDRYLQESNPVGAPDTSSSQEPQLAPGIKKAPAYMPPGAYPGDRTKLGKDYDKEPPVVSAPKPKPVNQGVESKYVKQSDRQDYSRANEGQTIFFKTAEDGEVKKAEIGGDSLPWALETTVRRMKIGDIMDVTGRGEHAFADHEEFVAGTERSWRLELLSIEGRSADKFSMDVDERITAADRLRLRGNDMFKKQRLLRALDYYERGSALMDVLEAEDLGMPGKTDSKAAERNARIWQCQKPLLLNWALILIKKERWVEAERKCTEVLMDIDKLNVKALFRRGQCNVRLGNHAQAHADLSRAAELDTSIAKEVEREMAQVRRLEEAADREDKALAKRLVTGFKEAGDARSDAHPPVESAPPGASPTERLMKDLQDHEAAADSNETDEDTYRRQRENIYRQFMAVQPAEPSD